MSKINYLKDKKKIDKKIYNDLKNFQKINNDINITVLPDIHYKKGEMSPTGCVLVSDKIIPFG